MANREITEIINKFIASIIPEYNPRMVVLFGSYARGSNTGNSDIDIAVIVDEVEGSFIEKEARLYKIRRSIDINIEPILLEKNNLNDKSGFLAHILSYGQVLFTRQ